jgi:hypothetical protein
MSAPSFSSFPSSFGSFPEPGPSKQPTKDKKPERRSHTPADRDRAAPETERARKKDKRRENKEQRPKDREKKSRGREYEEDDHLADADHIRSLRQDALEGYDSRTRPLYFSDRSGDPLNVRYGGLHTGDIPKHTLVGRKFPIWLTCGWLIIGRWKIYPWTRKRLESGAPR